jgi:hypothetical protein
MARIIGGILHRIDWDRGQAVIGGDTFELLSGLPVSPDLVAGTGVLALIAERDGARRIVCLRPNTAPRFISAAS